VLAIGAARQGGRHDQLAGIASAQSILRPRHHTPTILTQTLSFPCCKYRCDLTLSRWLYLMLQGLRTITKKWEGGVWGFPPHRCVLRSASLQGEQHTDLPIIYPQRSCQHNCVMITCRATQPTDLPHNPCDCATNRECRSPAFVGSCLNSTCICMTALYLPMPMSVLPVCQGTPAREQ
jgi:hypothetical protein